MFCFCCGEKRGGPWLGLTSAFNKNAVSPQRVCANLRSCWATSCAHNGVYSVQAYRVRAREVEREQALWPSGVHDWAVLCQRRGWKQTQRQVDKGLPFSSSCSNCFHDLSAHHRSIFAPVVISKRFHISPAHICHQLRSHIPFPNLFLGAKTASGFNLGSLY